MVGDVESDFIIYMQLQSAVVHVGLEAAIRSENAGL